MDWIGAAINLIGWYIMPKNKLIATSIFLISNLFWIGWGISHTTWSIVTVQVCFVILNFRAVSMWHREKAVTPKNWSELGAMLSSFISNGYYSVVMGGLLNNWFREEVSKNSSKNKAFQARI